jgi:hypothetical protein
MMRDAKGRFVAEQINTEAQNDVVRPQLVDDDFEWIDEEAEAFPWGAVIAALAIFAAVVVLGVGALAMILRAH